MLIPAGNAFLAGRQKYKKFVCRQMEQRLEPPRLFSIQSYSQLAEEPAARRARCAMARPLQNLYHFSLNPAAKIYNSRNEL